jgi:hypothetical protein
MGNILQISLSAVRFSANARPPLPAALVGRKACPRSAGINRQLIFLVNKRCLGQPGDRFGKAYLHTL